MYSENWFQAFAYKFNLYRCDKRAEFTGMMRDCERDLREKGVLRHAKVFIAPDVAPGEFPELRRALGDMGAVLAANQFEDGVTHVLHREQAAAGGAGGGAGVGGAVGGVPGTAAAAAAAAEGQPVSGEGAAAAAAAAAAADTADASCVVLGVSGKEALVHYRRHPGSYDQWLSVATATQNAAPGSSPNLTSPPPEDDAAGSHLGLPSSRAGGGGGAVHLLAGWMLDSARFNEWCAEDDYAWEDPAVVGAVHVELS
jgi:SWI/SNF related-matrix-associated actin-dependent regulator of chromatin subfamily C